ncbi:ornithine carbamoyltransferase [Paenibacillus sp. sptzw28]|uniref:ornithine carbamoyltransferase n=1 Tax=Paenibacillus sp. sptzw28 TaxID=715179 RepID=UPI001C6E1D0B|nr:ornithine carbamoyltransferase [Paenibacillus sp. sptzw28]QYR21270.1 ornithine carbamoyltransferase [Paenibacillus sp. sptzw28]
MHFLNLSDLSVNKMTEIFNIAEKLKNNKFGKILEGKTFVLFFPESSIRTRVTFEKGIKDLGGECILFPPESLKKKEELADVIGYLNNWVDAVIVRHPDFNNMIRLSEHALIPIINAMSSENHPCEVLSDIFSIREIRPDFKELTYTFVGPAGNIVNSWVEIAKVLDLKLYHVCTTGNEICNDDRNYHFSTDLETKLVGSDFVLTDSLPLEYQTDEYCSQFQVNFERMKLTNANALLNPCPPFFRNQEVSEDVINSKYFVGYSFKKNLVFVQQALIIHCLGLFKEGADIL